jgi:hypothetical protein
VLNRPSASEEMTLGTKIGGEKSVASSAVEVNLRLVGNPYLTGLGKSSPLSRTFLPDPFRKPLASGSTGARTDISRIVGKPETIQKR